MTTEEFRARRRLAKNGWRSIKIKRKTNGTTVVLRHHWWQRSDTVHVYGPNFVDALASAEALLQT